MICTKCNDNLREAKDSVVKNAIFLICIECNTFTVSNRAALDDQKLREKKDGMPIYGCVKCDASKALYTDLADLIAEYQALGKRVLELTELNLDKGHPLWMQFTSEYVSNQIKLKRNHGIAVNLPPEFDS